MNRVATLLVAAMLAFPLAGCPSDPPASPACTRPEDCAAGQTCTAGHCVPANASDDAGSDPEPGERDAGAADVGFAKDASATPVDPTNESKDTDCDGLSDAEEFANTYPGGRKTDPEKPDSDGDGLSDGLELGRGESVSALCTAFVGDASPETRTSPVDADSDADGLPDGREDANANGRRDPGETDPGSSDSDGDGLSDGLEDRDHNGKLDSGETDPTQRDSDGDRIPDGVEDRNHNGTVDSGETSPVLADTDADGCPDGNEDKNWNGKVEAGETDPLKPGDCNVELSADADCDGLADKDEPGLGTEATKPDTDGDGLLDGLELGATTNRDPTRCTAFKPDADSGSRTNPARVDSDCDGLRDGVEDANGNGRVDSGETDPMRRDTDGDGLTDGVEKGICDNADAAHCTVFVKDGDCGTTLTSPTTADTDGDGIPDGAEDLDQDGTVDSGELDPLNKADGTGPAQQACGADNLRRVTVHESSAPDLTVAVAPSFTEIARPQVGGAERAVMVYDPTNKVAGFALSVAPNGSEVSFDESAGLAKLRTIATVTDSTAQTFTTWDKYPAVHAVYTLAGSADVKDRANAIVRGFLGSSATDVLSGTAGASGPFYVVAEYVRRSSTRTVVVMAIMPQSAYRAAKPFHLTDLGGGSALAQFGDTNAAQCERFQTQPAPKVDFLWIVDNSQSMEAYQRAVANAGTLMLSKLENSVIDWRMAATSTAYYEGPDCGWFTCDWGDDGLRPFTKNIDTIRGWFTPGGNDWFGITSSGDERPLQSAKKVLDDELLPTATNSATRVRTGATLVIILLGDEDDGSPNSATYYANYFKSLGLKTQVHAIACPEGKDCSTEPDLPRKVLPTVRLMGGVSGDIDVANQPGGSLGPTIDAILNAAIAGVSPYTTTKPPIATTIKLAVDPSAITNTLLCNPNDVPRDRSNGFDFDAVSQRILFFGACRPSVSGKQAAISYRYWSDLTSNPNGTPDPCGGRCKAPLTCDRDSGQCACPSDCGTPAPGRTYLCDTSTCKWTCSPDCNGCASNFSCNPQSCACECNQNVSCGVGFKFDKTACACVCDTAALGCKETENADATLCACTCKEGCGGCAASEKCSMSLCRCVPGLN